MISTCPSPLGTRPVGPEWRAGPWGAGHTTSCLKVSCVADAGWIEAAVSIPEPPSCGQGTKLPWWQHSGPEELGPKWSIWVCEAIYLR